MCGRAPTTRCSGLIRKPFAACMAEREAMAPAFAKLGKPLRVRFEENETAVFQPQL